MTAISITTFLLPLFVLRKHGRQRTVAPWLDRAAKLAILIFSGCILYLATTRQARDTTLGLLWAHRAGQWLLMVGGSYAGLCAVWSAWRFALALLYRPSPNVEDDQLPNLTVVVPCFNEEALIRRTLHRLAAADYPRDRMEIIVVDDGSTDDTWRHIREAADALPGRIQSIRFSANRGKRHALYEGFCRARGDILVTVDSDSLIEPDALRAIAAPFVRDAAVGAVAGNVRVLNPADGLIPRLLAIRYVMTFDYKRAAQSVMSGGAVQCVAGALAAYRKSATLPVLEDWLHQTYLGRPARAGEDHAMTNYIFRQGYKCVFQRTARVRTMCPTTYAGICRMFLRWARSNVRETLHLASFLFKPHPPRRRLAAKVNFLIGATGLFLPYCFLAATLGLALVRPEVFGLKLLAACVAGGLFPMAFVAARERTSEAALSIVYSFYVTLLLAWIWPYALLTSHRSVWLTRGTTRPQSARGHAGRQITRSSRSPRAGSRRHFRLPRPAHAGSRRPRPAAPVSGG